MEQRDWVSQIPLTDVDFISVTYSSKVWSVFGRVVVAAVVVADVDDVDGVVSDVVAVGVVDYVDGVVADIDGVVSDVVAVGGGWVIAANGDGFVWSLSRVLALHLSATSGRKNLNEGQFSNWTNHSFLLSCFRSHLIPPNFGIKICNEMMDEWDSNEISRFWPRLMYLPIVQTTLVLTFRHSNT